MDPAMTRSGEESEEIVWQEALDWTIRLNGTQPNAAENAAFSDWLSRSELHRAAYRRADRVWALTGAAQRSDPSLSVRGKRPRASALGRVTRRRRLVLAGALLAASIALLLAGRFETLLSSDIRTTQGETRELQLEDGSVLWLNADSAVAVDYASNARTLRLLSGEVMVKVASDPRPFSLTATDLTVTDIGTVFDVDLQPQALIVGVQEGRVKVLYRRDQIERSVEIQAREQVRVDRDNGAFIRSVIDPAQVGDWRSRQLVANAMPIGDLVAELRRYYSGFIVVRDSAFAARLVSGVFDLNDPIRAIRAAVQPYAGEVRTYTPLLVTVSGPADPSRH